MAWLLDRVGPRSLSQVAAYVGVSPPTLARSAAPALARLHRGLFPTREAVVAFAVLVALETGIGPQGMARVRRD